MLDIGDIQPNETGKAIQWMRLKKNQFNHLLMSYIRSVFKPGYKKAMKAKLPSESDGDSDVEEPVPILISQPDNLGFEKICLKRY